LTSIQKTINNNILNTTEVALQWAESLRSNLFSTVQKSRKQNEQSSNLNDVEDEENPEDGVYFNESEDDDSQSEEVFYHVETESSSSEILEDYGTIQLDNLTTEHVGPKIDSETLNDASFAANVILSYEDLLLLKGLMKKLTEIPGSSTLTGPSVEM